MTCGFEFHRDAVWTVPNTRDRSSDPPWSCARSCRSADVRRASTIAFNAATCRSWGRHQRNRKSALPSLVGRVVRPANCPRVAHTRSRYLRQYYTRGGGGDPARGLTTFVLHRHWAHFLRPEGQSARLIAAWLQDNCLIGLVHNAKIPGQRVPAPAKGQPEHDKKRGSPHRRQLSSAPYPHHMVSVGRCRDPRRGTPAHAALCADATLRVGRALNCRAVRGRYPAGRPRTQLSRLVRKFCPGTVSWS